MIASAQGCDGCVIFRGVFAMEFANPFSYSYAQCAESGIQRCDLISVNCTERCVMCGSVLDVAIGEDVATGDRSTDTNYKSGSGNFNPSLPRLVLHDAHEGLGTPIVDH